MSGFLSRRLNPWSGSRFRACAAASSDLSCASRFNMGCFWLFTCLTVAIALRLVNVGYFTRRYRSAFPYEEEQRERHQQAQQPPTGNSHSGKKRRSSSTFVHKPRSKARKVTWEELNALHDSLRSTGRDVIGIAGWSKTSMLLPLLSRLTPAIFRPWQYGVEATKRKSNFHRILSCAVSTVGT